jgi:hypothetical protein
VVHVDLHRARGDKQLTANLCVGESFAEKVINLALARRERNDWVHEGSGRHPEGLKAAIVPSTPHEKDCLVADTGRCEKRGKELWIGTVRRNSEIT